MRKLILRDERHVPPFNEEARDLRVNNKPLWLNQRDALARYATHEAPPVADFNALPRDGVETLVYRDNLFFDERYIDAFMSEAR